MTQPTGRLHWPHVVTLTFSLVLGGPAAGDNAACEAAVVDYYARHSAPHNVADAYTASKAAFDHAISKGHRAAIAALRVEHGIDTSDVIVRTAVVEAAQAINAATVAAGEAAEAAEAAHALWIALGTGTSRYSALEALNIENAAFLSAVHFTRAGKKSVEESIEAIVYAGSRADKGKALDILSTVMDADGAAGIYESLADFEDAKIVGIGEFVGAVKSFHAASEEAVLRAKNAATTLEFISSAAACG